MPSNQQCFSWPQHFRKHWKHICRCFSVITPWQHGILLQHLVCTTHHWLNPLWGTAVKIIFTTSYINPGNCNLCHKISHSSFITGKNKIRNITFWATSQDNLVSTVTSVQTEQSRDRFQAGVRDFSLLQNVQTNSNAQPASYSVGIRCSCPGNKVAGARS